MQKNIKLLCLILVIIGALNWGLVGILDFDLVAAIFGDMSIISRIVYSLVGLAGVILVIMAPSCYEKHKNDM